MPFAFCKLHEQRILKTQRKLGNKHESTHRKNVAIIMQINYSFSSIFRDRISDFFDVVTNSAHLLMSEKALKKVLVPYAK